ncbi:hypothetical protein [Skermanella stibiiresistens]|uniref:hypothetical protein n=1 Tax=Skermanella stibiiresistens TaxID=913326 RepID=UPI0012F7467A|nr:hypothetical protein [Skermanella stibiiresistens]
MRTVIAATALLLAASVAGPALAGEGGCAWSQSVKANGTTTTQTAQTTTSTATSTAPNGG